jgi:hypothetical protein
MRIAICRAHNVTMSGYLTKRPEMAQIVMLLPEQKIIMLFVEIPQK